MAKTSMKVKQSRKAKFPLRNTIVAESADVHMLT